MTINGIKTEIVPVQVKFSEIAKAFRHELELHYDRGEGNENYEKMIKHYNEIESYLLEKQ